MSVVPLLMGPPFTFARLLTTGMLAAIAVLMLGSGRARRLSIVVDLDSGTLTRGTRVTSLSRVSALRLGGAQQSPERAPHIPYRVEVLLGDGRRECLLERDEPASVLQDLARVLRVWRLPVQRGWGLPQHARPWQLDDEKAAPIQSAPAIDVSGRSSPAAHGGALATALGGGLVAFVITLILLARLRRNAPVDALSLILPGLSLGLLILLSTYLATARLRVSTNDGLVVERRAFGLPWTRFSVPAPALLGVFAVAADPDPESPSHLLVQTRQGPFAFRCTRELAQAVVDALHPRATPPP
ncbi:MAG TPA: hypothetical protein VK524_21505 [Polyangiaceae bacterium]|nr:hypothetical protein [Polyangiaceae bacterium]